MGEKNSKEFEIVTVQQVKSLIQENFPKLDVQTKSFTPQFFDFSKNTSPKGCFVSVKIPTDITEPGQALHLLIKHEYLTKTSTPELKTYVVYPSTKYMAKRGRGSKESLSVFRTKGWQRNLMLETRIGMNICHVLNESGQFYNEIQRKEIYDNYMEYLDSIEAMNTKRKHCEQLNRQSAKDKCQSELKELEKQHKEKQHKLKK